jgi:hypothetical protein
MNRAYLAFRRRGDRIETDQSTGRDDDLPAAGSRDVYERIVLEKRAAAQDDRLLPGSQERLNDLCQEMRRRAFHDEIGERLQRIYRDDRHLMQVRQTGSRAVEVSRGDRGEHATLYARIERLGDLEPDGAETRNRNPHGR